MLHPEGGGEEPGQRGGDQAKLGLGKVQLIQEEENRGRECGAQGEEGYDLGGAFHEWGSEASMTADIAPLGARLRLPPLCSRLLRIT